MKRLQTVLLCVLGLAMTVGSASAAILFIKPEKRTVSPQPEHMAIADLDGDGFQDIVTTSPRSKEVNILFGNPDGVLTPGQVITLGNQLRSVAIGELNGDGQPDIVVIDERSDGVFVMLNQADRTFAAPVLHSVGRNPWGVAISDFDGVMGNDLAITDRAVDRVFIRLNDGRPNPSFARQGGDYLVGLGPETIIAADFNDDGAADLVTLNTGGTRVKSVTVLLFRRVQATFPVFEVLTNFGVGERPESMITGDFNGDDERDLAMINRPAGSLRDGQVQFLFGVGDGFLNLVNPLDVPCPFFTNGLACRPRALGSGDFDADGKIDLAVTMTDPREEKLGDILNIYIGTGDGFYLPGPVFITDPRPFVLGVGNITGADGLPDIVVNAFQLSTVQVFVNNSSAPEDDRIPGQRCENGNQCTTGYCIDDVCCRAECLPGELCDIGGFEGTCQPADGNLPNGRPCETADQCESDFCTNDTCCVVGTCPTDGRCDIPGSEGTCTIPLANGEPCVADEHCRTGNCRDGFCCENECLNGRCDTPNRQGECVAPLPLGQGCTLDDQCDSGICDIVGRICCAETCAATEECTVNGQDCGPPRTPDPNVTPTVPPGDPGSTCGNDSQCDSGDCNNGICCAQPNDCSGNEVCAAGSGVCATRTPTGRSGTPTSTPDLSCGVCPDDCPCVNGLCLCAGRSGGGCSTSDTQDSRVLYLALLLPIGFLVARRWQTARARTRR